MWPPCREVVIALLAAGKSVLEMGGRVEVVDGDAKKKLDKPGGIAAMLRY